MKGLQKNRQVICIATVLIFVFSSSAQVLSPKVGGPAPELGLDKLLQAPEGAKADWKSLKGKVVVLEFWSTWCGPCVAAIPHLNELAEKFKDKPVQFISITNEDEAVVTKFLKQHPMKSWIGFDTDESMFKAYGVKGIPRMVLVDQNANVAGITGPRSLTDEILNDLVAGKAPKLGEYVEPALYQVLIRPAHEPEMVEMFSSSRQFASDAVTLHSAIQNICGDDWPKRTPIETTVPLHGEYYRIVVEAPNKDLLEPMFHQAIEETFNLKIRHEKRKEDVLVLTASEETSSRLLTASSPSPSGSVESGRKRFLVDLHNLTGYLSRLMEKRVVDETGLDGSYDFQLDYGEEDAATVTETLRDKFDLVLTPAKREIKVLVVEKREK